MTQRRLSTPPLVPHDEMEAIGKRFEKRIDVLSVADQTRALLDPSDRREVWRYYPFMLLENPTMGVSGTQPGVLYHDVASDGKKFPFTVFLLTHEQLKQLTREEFQAAEGIEYNSLDELVGAGWMPVSHFSCA